MYQVGSSKKNHFHVLVTTAYEPQMILLRDVKVIFFVFYNKHKFSPSFEMLVLKHFSIKFILIVCSKCKECLIKKIYI